MHEHRFRWIRRSVRAIVAVVPLTAISIAGPPPAGAQTPRTGVNVTWPQDWAGDRMFADAMKTSRPWTPVREQGTAEPNPLPAASLDANGWPKVNARVRVFTFAGPPHSGVPAINLSGTYEVSFLWQSADPKPKVWHGEAYDNNPVSVSLVGGRYVGTVSVTGNQLVLTFESAVAGSNTLAISDLRVMRPTTAGGATPYPHTTVFTDQIQTFLAKFQAIRFMDYLQTNSNPLVQWSERTKPGHASQDRLHSSGEKMGGALEYTVMLCNAINRDLWINVPIQANDQYLTKLAQLIAFGSNGTEPYTTTQASPLFPPLNSGLKVYIEYSNEVWNADIGTQYEVNVNLAIAEGGALQFDPTSDAGSLGARRTAKRTVEISNAFRAVFGDAAMMTRIRPILAAQAANPGGWAVQQAHMMQDYYNTSSRVATPRPPSYYVYGGGGSAYYEHAMDNPSLTLAQLWNSDEFDPAVWRPESRDEANLALPMYGHRLAYEGGPNLDPCCPGSTQCTCLQTQISSWQSTNMTQEIIEHQRVFDETGGELLMYFTGAVAAEDDYFRWSFTHDPYYLSTPKIAGIDAINATTRAAAIVGSVWPGNQLFTSSSRHATTWPADYDSDPLDLQATGEWTWFSYVVHTVQDTFDVVLEAGSSGSGNVAEVYIDGQLLGSLSIPNTGGMANPQLTSALRTSQLTAGSHGVLIKARTGSFGVRSVNATSTTSTPGPEEEPPDILPPPHGPAPDHVLWWLASTTP